MDAYEPLDVIGSGSFGIIRKVRRKSDGMVLARKEIDYSKMSDKEKRQLVAEVNILRELRHPNIVRYYERFVDREKCMIYIIMEYCEGGDLAAVIKQCKKENKRIPEDIIWNLTTQLLMALQECHHGSAKSSHPTILHRDIKPDNVFLDSSQNVKLGDFGLSRTISNPEEEFAKTYVGTPFYMSPELVNETSYNTKSDVWALGCLIYELCTLEPPFQANTQANLSAKIRIGKINPLPSQYSAELNAVVKAMLNVNHMKRPSTTEILKLNRVRLYIKERELTQFHAELKKREEELKKKEALLRSREAAVAAREEEVKKREAFAMNSTGSTASSSSSTSSTPASGSSGSSSRTPALVTPPASAPLSSSSSSSGVSPEFIRGSLLSNLEAENVIRALPERERGVQALEKDRLKVPHVLQPPPKEFRRPLEERRQLINRNSPISQQIRQRENNVNIPTLDYNKGSSKYVSTQPKHPSPLHAAAHRGGANVLHVAAPATQVYVGTQHTQTNAGHATGRERLGSMQHGYYMPTTPVSEKVDGGAIGGLVQAASSVPGSPAVMQMSP
ncbi:G2-specific serine/threonine protein kinase [Chytridiales sp. JEL 0842]|nr:G2-specific serine/threonine protein kinase [Chytridiales sp. JEL 0842]